MRITFIMPAIAKNVRAVLKFFHQPPLSVATLAGLTPPGHEMAFFDDRIEDIPEDHQTDLAAITVETYTARRSYAIADDLRRKGIPVVLGGYHPSLVPEEAKQHADAVVVGEAEFVWARVLQDAQRHELKPLYESRQWASMEGLRPDRALFRGKRYAPVVPVESARGCRYACEFCAVAQYSRSTYRPRPPKETAAEIESLGKRRFFLVDDNFSADPQRAKTLMRELAPLKVNWMSQADVKIADDPEFLDLLEKSGCTLLLMGFESLAAENLRSMNKSTCRTAGDYAEAIKKIRDRGVKLYATFVFGYDGDTPELLDQTLQFALEQKFFMADFNNLHPWPSTPLYRRLEAEDRLLYKKWWLEPDWQFERVAFRTKGIDHEEFQERIMRMRRQFYSVGNVLRRAADLKANSRTPLAAIEFLIINRIIHRMYQA